MIDQAKYKKASKRKWKDTEYRVQEDHDVAHKDVNIFCNTNQFPSIYILWYINQSKQDLQRHLVCLTDFDHDYILEEIECREKSEYETNIRYDGDEE